MEAPVIVGDDPIVRRVAALAARLAATTHPICITGESGTGREHVARFLHARGPRAVAPFSQFDCGAAVRGACIDDIAPAANGTLLLANCDALSRADVAALAARVTGAGARVVLTSGRADVELAERLGALSLYLPPLRLRRADVPALVRHFAALWAGAHGVASVAFSNAAMLALWHHDWPGNVRQLRDEVRAALERSPDGVVDPSHLPARLFPGPRRADARCSGGHTRIPQRTSPMFLR